MQREAIAAGGTPVLEDVTIPENLGLDCGQYIWRQNLSHVEVFVPLPMIDSKQVVRRGGGGEGEDEGKEGG